MLQVRNRYLMDSLILVEPKPDKEGYIRVFPDGTFISLPTSVTRDTVKREGAVLHRVHFHA